MLKSHKSFSAMQRLTTRVWDIEKDALWRVVDQVSLLQMYIGDATSYISHVVMFIAVFS